MAAQGSSASASPSLRRRIVRLLPAFAVIVCLLIVLLLFALHSAPARRFAVNRVTSLLASQQIELRTDELNYNLFTLSIDLRNIRVRATAPSAPIFATIGRAQLNLSLSQLLRGRYVVDGGSVEGVDIHYFVDADGRDNLPRPLADPNEAREPLDYLIANLSANGRLHYENRAQDIDLVLPLDSVAITGDALTDRHQISVASSGGQGRIQRRWATIDRFAGEIDLGDDDLTISQLDLQVLGSHVNLTGSLRRFDAPEIDVRVKADVAAASAATLADVTEPVDGRLSIDATATGPLAAPAVNARMSGSSLQFGSLTGLEIDVGTAYDPAGATVEIASARAQAPWGSASLTGQLALNEQNRSRVEATFSGVDAAVLMRAFEQPQRIATRVDGMLRADWRGLEYLKAEGEGHATLTPTTARIVRGELPVVGRVTLRADGNGVVTRLDRVTAAGAQVAGQVAIDSARRVRGELRGNVADVMQTTGALEAFLGRPRGSLMPAAVAGAMTIGARIDGTLDAPTSAATLAAPSLAIGNATGIALDADLRYAPNALRISRADLRWLEAHAALSGSVGLTGARPVELTVDATAVDLQALLRATNQPALPVSGTFATQGAVTGTVTRPLAAFAVQGTELVAYEERFGTLVADVTVTGPDVSMSRLVIDKPQPDGDGQITGTGSYNLDRKSYMAALASKNVRLVGLTLPGGQRIRGDVQAAAKGSGTVASPAGSANLTIDGLEIDGLTAQASDTSDVTETTRWGRVDIAATAANGQATVNASAPRFNVSADANIGLERPWPATVKVRANDADLAALPIALETPLTGTFRGTIDAAGPLAEPAQGQAMATIDRFDGSWNQQPFSVTGPSRLQYANERLGIERLELAAGDSSLVVSGALPLTGRAGRGEIAIEGHANLATLAQYLPAGTDLTGDGAVTVTGTLRGTLKAIDPDLVLSVDDGLVLSRRIEPGLSNIRLRARVMNGAADVEQLTANWGSASIDASGRIPLEVAPPLPVEIPRMGGPATFKASVRDLDPAAIPGAPSGLSGRISLDAEAAASRADLAALEGRITFPELQVAFNGLDLAQQDPSTIAIASGAATIERLSLSGSGGSLATTGSVGLAGERPLNLDVNGDLQIAAVSALTERVRAEGAARLNVAARGTLTAPQLNGTVALADATLVSDEPNVAAENIAAELTLAGSRVELTRLSADINGGTLDGSGTLALGAGTVSDIDLQFTARDVAYDAPMDLRSLSDSTIRVTRRGDDILVTGQVTIDEAGQTADINFDEGLFAAINARPTLDLTEERNPLLERVRFNVDVDTATPILVENNLAHAEVDVDVRVVGTPYEPGLTGRLNLLEGAEITLNERRYEVERGVITFVDERRIVPSVDLLLNTSAGNYDITIAVTGEPGQTETTLTSSPTLPEPDIMAMLVTGRTLDEMRGEEYEVAREQVLSYLAGRLGSRLGRGIERATGLSEVRVEPQLIANETDPAARLTVGQELTDELKLVYSTNLADSNDEIWLAEYDVTRRFQAQTVRQSDNSYRFDFRHDVRFGGEPEPRRQPRHRPTIAHLAITTDSSEAPALQERLNLKEGDSYDFFAVRRGVERIEETFVEQGYLQSRVRLERKVEGERADLTVRVERGPLVELRFEGATPPAKVQEEVRVQWHRGVFDKQRGDDSADALRAWLMGDDHLQPRVDYEIMDEGDSRRAVVFRIQPGPRYRRVLLAFDGASGIDPDQLDAIIDQQKLERQMFTDPVVVTALLERYYHEQGFLSATIEEPRYEFQGDTARVVMTVNEGPRFTVRSLTASGNSVFTTDELVSGLSLVAGDLYLPSAAEHSLERIRASYWRKGYNDVRSDYALAVDRAAGQVDLEFTLVEGQQSVIAEIAVEGAANTSEHLVREQVELATARPLDLGALAKSRRNLYDTGAFSIVDITREDLEGDQPVLADAGADAEQPEQQKPVRLNISVREVQPFQLRYGASFDNERGIGGILDISNHNSLGKARVLGLQSRYDGELREGRVYVSQPSLRYWPLKTTGSIYIREERNPPTSFTDPFDVSRKGASVQQEMELRDAYVWSYGYRYERATTLQPSLGAGIGETLTVSPLTATLTRETRDEVLDASRGAFLSQAFAYSPGWLGSDLPYLKYFGQYFHYFPLRPPQRKPFTNEILRPRLVYATGVRLGLARGTGGSVPTSERFYAGGSTTLRGFEQNAVGPIGANNVPAGGNMLLVLNNELHAPLAWILDGVLFMDIGNVFARVTDVSLTDLRKSAGVGLRVRTPWFLIRGDYGLVIDRREGERRGRFYFSIGQAF